MIWSPFTQDNFSELNSVLTRFLRYASYKSGKPMPFDNHDFGDIFAECGVYKLETVHHYNELNRV